jgi:hypothetical protein
MARLSNSTKVRTMTLRSASLPLTLLAFAACSSSSPSNPDAGMKHDGSSHVDAPTTHDTGMPPPGSGTGTGSGTSPGMDAGDYPDGDCATTSCTSAVPQIYTIEAGTTWSSLYRDYFGTSGVASCSGTGSDCHGNTNGAGYASSGYLCPPHDAGACYEGFTTQSPTGPMLIAGDAGFAASGVSDVLCQCDGNGGFMPYGCCYYFQAADMQRIADWVNAGATNDYLTPPKHDAGAPDGAATDAHGADHDAADGSHDAGDHDAQDAAKG